MSDEDVNGYKKEYYVILDGSMSLSVEHAWLEKSKWHDEGYAYFESDVLYIIGDASYNIVKTQGKKDCDIYELVLDDIIYFDSECEDTGCCSDGDCEQCCSHRLDLTDLIDFLEYLVSPDSYKSKEDCEHDEVLEFINRRFPIDCNWNYENCYYFALILKDRFPGGAIYYDVINGHFSYSYNDNHYDHTGIIKPDGYLVSWDEFDNYDSIQKQRIIRDCLK